MFVFDIVAFFVDDALCLLAGFLGGFLGCFLDAVRRSLRGVDDGILDGFGGLRRFFLRFLDRLVRKFLAQFRSLLFGNAELSRESLSEPVTGRICRMLKNTKQMM